MTMCFWRLCSSGGDDGSGGDGGKTHRVPLSLACATGGDDDDKANATTTSTTSTSTSSDSGSRFKKGKVKKKDRGVTTATGATRESLIREAGVDKLVMVKFFEEDCEDCDVMSKRYEKFSDKYPKVLFLEASVEANPEIVDQICITQLPTFVAFKNHEEVGRVANSDLKKVEKLIRKQVRRKRRS